MPEIRELIGKVAERNGVRLDEDDPIFAVTTVNELMLKEAGDKMVSQLRQIVDEFKKSAEAIDERAGVLFAKEVQRSATAWRDQIRDDIKAAGRQGEKLVAAAARSYTWGHMIMWGTAGVVAGAILVGFGVVLGRYWR